MEYLSCEVAGSLEKHSGALQQEKSGLKRLCLGVSAQGANSGEPFSVPVTLSAHTDLPADSCRGRSLMSTMQHTGKLHAMHLDRQVTRSKGPCSWRQDCYERLSKQ